MNLFAWQINLLVSISYETLVKRDFRRNYRKHTKYKIWFSQSIVSLQMCCLFFLCMVFSLRGIIKQTAVFLFFLIFCKKNMQSRIPEECSGRKIRVAYLWRIAFSFALLYYSLPIEHYVRSQSYYYICASFFCFTWWMLNIKLLVVENSCYQFLIQFISVYIYIYIYIIVCKYIYICVCVCMRGCMFKNLLNSDTFVFIFENEIYVE